MSKYDKVMEGVKECTKYPKIIHGVSGMLSRPEAEWLHRIPRVVGDGWYVDLGTFRGRSACLMADTIRSENLAAQIFTVDTFDDRGISRRFRSDGSIETSSGDGKDHSIGVIQTFKDKGLDGYIDVIKSTTVEAVGFFEGDGVDFLFIDADHSYEGVSDDFWAWQGKVVEGGFIAFHDSHRGGVTKLHDYLTTWEEFDRVDTLSVWRRK